MRHAYTYNLKRDIKAMPLLQDGQPLSFSVIQGQDQNSRLQLRQHMAFRQKIFDVNWQVFSDFS